MVPDWSSETRFMADYLVAEHGLSRPYAYVLTSIAADLRLAEVEDMPQVLLTMHIPKAIFTK
jgi:acetamidase/formamidase